MTYTEFKNAWNNRRVDYDNVYGYQCVDLILQYVKECYGLQTGVSGNAIDYWYRTSPALLGQFNKVTGNAQQGDIVVLFGQNGNPYGHIGIADRQDGSGIWLLEQNALGNGDGVGRNAIGVYRAISPSRVAGILRPKSAQPVPSGSGTAKAIRQAYVRTSPSTSAPLGGSQLLQVGDTFTYKGKVAGQLVSQNGVTTNIWYNSTRGNYVWSGNCKDI